MGGFATNTDELRSRAYFRDEVLGDYAEKNDLGLAAFELYFSLRISLTGSLKTDGLQVLQKSAC